MHTTTLHDTPAATAHTRSRAVVVTVGQGLHKAELEAAASRRFKWFYLFALFAVLVWFGWLRLWKLQTHATTPEDLSVAAHYLAAERAYQYDSLHQRYAQQATTQKNLTGGQHHNLLQLLDSWGLLKPGHTGVSYAYKALANTLYGGAAPALHIIGAALVTQSQSYGEVKFFGRLPAAICSILALAAIPIVARRLTRNHFSWVPLIAMLMMATSWQQFWLARQMGTHTAGMLAILIMVARLAWVCRFNFKHSPAWHDALLITILVLFHYQVVYYVPAYIVAVLLYGNSTAPTSWRVRNAMLTSFWLLLFLVPLAFILKINPEPAMPWYQAEGDYIFHWLPKASLWQQAQHFLLFWLWAAHDLVTSHLGFLPPDMGMKEYGWVLIPVIFYGIWKHHNTEHSINKAVVWYAIVATVTWVVLGTVWHISVRPGTQTALWAPLLMLFAAQGMVSIVIDAVTAGIALVSKTAHPNWRYGISAWFIGTLVVGAVSGYMLYFRYIRHEWSDVFGLGKASMMQLQRSYPSSLLISTDWTLNAGMLWPNHTTEAGQLEVIDLNTADDIKQVQLSAQWLEEHRPVHHCYVLGPASLNEDCRRKVELWLQAQGLTHEDHRPLILASRSFAKHEHAGYYPREAMPRLNCRLWLVALTPSAIKQAEKLQEEKDYYYAR